MVLRPQNLSLEFLSGFAVFLPLLFSVFLSGCAVFPLLLFSVFLSGLPSEQSNLSHNWAIHCTYNMNGYNPEDLLPIVEPTENYIFIIALLSLSYLTRSSMKVVPVQ